MSMKEKMTESEKKFVRDTISDDLEKQNLEDWQKACSSFGPFNYRDTTRKRWFEKNKTKVATGKKILAFVDKWAKTLRKEDKLSTVRMSTIRVEIVEGIRDAQQKQDITSNRLNTFKIATFKTLISWTENPSKLEEGPYEGKTQIPEGARKAKTKVEFRKINRFRAPLVNLVKQVKISGNTLNLEVVVANGYVHPYQNVELQLEVDSALTVESVDAYKWKSSKKTIEIGFLPASLSDDVLKTSINIKLGISKTSDSYSIGGFIKYDDCNRGKLISQELGDEIITT